MRFSNRRCGFFLFIAFNAISPSHLIAEMRVVTLIADQWATENGEGFASEMFHQLSLLTGAVAELEIYPVNHAINLISTHRVDCFFGGTKQGIQEHSLVKNLSLIESKTITGDSIFAFTRKDKPQITNFQQLTNKSIVATSVTFDRLKKIIPSEIYQSLSVTEVATISQGIRLVNADRADVLFRFRSTLTNEFSNNFHYDRHFALFSTEDKIVCQQSAATADYLQRINNAIDLGIHNDALNNIYKKYQRLTPDELK